MPFNSSANEAKNNAGDPITESTTSFDGTAPLTALAKSTASANVLFIFQFPAIIGLRIEFDTPFIYR